MPQLNNYYTQRENYNIETLNRLMKQLPFFCRDYFLAISQSKQILTRVNYCRDQIIYFRYICNEILDNPKMNTADVTWDVFSTVTPDDIDRYMDYLSYYEVDGVQYHNLEDGKARKLAAVSALYGFFLKRDKLPSNPVDKVERPALHKKNIIALNETQIKNLINAIASGENLTKTQSVWHEKTVERDLAIVITALGTGLRVSELVGLNIEDIDFEESSLKVIRKGGNEDLVYFGEEVEDALRAYLEKTKEVKYETMEEPLHVSARQLLLPSPNSKEPALFISRNGTRITVRSVERLVKKYSLGVVPNKKISPHKLRSTYATRLNELTNGDVMTIKESLGHSSVQTSMRYIEYSADRKKKAAQAMNRFSD